MLVAFILYTIYFGYTQQQSIDYAISIKEVLFTNKLDILQGSLVVPISDKPCPALIMIHGSGAVSRDITYAKKLAKKGIAVLTYDKRGCGNSEGKYESTLNVSTKNINLLADDAIAGLAVLCQDSRIDQTLIGIWGYSQAGWIAPIVANKSPIVSYIVMVSGPTVNVRQEMKYSMLSEKHPKYLKTHTPEKIIKDISMWRFSDIFFTFADFNLDPAKDISKLNIPMLYLYGDQDTSIPSYACKDILLKMGKKNITIISYQGYDHPLQGPGDKNGPSERVNIDITNWIMKLSSKI
jgi:dienelactone hydrolase